jgi:hypothetical protein
MNILHHIEYLGQILQVITNRCQKKGGVSIRCVRDDAAEYNFFTSLV